MTDQRATDNAEPERLDDLVAQWRQLNDERLAGLAGGIDEDTYKDLSEHEAELAFKIAHMLGYKVDFVWHWKGL